MVIMMNNFVLLRNKKKQHKKSDRKNISETKLTLNILAFCFQYHSDTAGID